MGTQTSRLALRRTINESEICLSNELWIEYLCHGYLRTVYGKYEIRLESLCYELSLIQIMSQYLDDTFIVFDMYPPECQPLIRECGTIFNRKASDDDHFGLITVGSSKGWSDGIHKLIIKSMTYAHMFDAFGIITNISEFNNECKWYTDEENSDDYVALNGCCVVSKYKIPDYNRYTVRTNDCKPGDIIQIIFNGNEWNVSFWFNGEIIGDPMKLTPNMTYYPFISSNEYNNYNAKYQLIYE